MLFHCVHINESAPESERTSDAFTGSGSFTGLSSCLPRSTSLARLACALVFLLGCTDDRFDPPSYISEFRILAVKAEPPEVMPGQQSVLSPLAVDVAGQPISIDWALCTRPPLPGSNTTVNPDCLRNDSAPYLMPVGQGLVVSVTMPMLTPADLGPADSSGGQYVPIRLRAMAPPQRVDAIYRLRYGQSSPPNQNPRIADVFVVRKADAAVPPELVRLDESTPFSVSSGEKITLRATFAAGSVESYQAPSSDPLNPAPRAATELLRVSWFATAGDFSEDRTGEEKPDTLFSLDIRLPAPKPDGNIIDLYVVGRDERGGTDFVHRMLRLH